MTNVSPATFLGSIKHRLEFLYGDEAEQCIKRLHMLFGRYEVLPIEEKPAPHWTEKDSILITYGDTIKKEGEHPLQSLHTFAKERIGDAVSGIHILPFFPYSSDDGFSVIDYRKVREDLGGWWQITDISKDYRLMADLVINHVSQKSIWFKDYTKGIAPYSDFFIEEDPETDLSGVTRPRTSPLLTKVQTETDDRYVWCTFSADQVDVDFSNPDVLFEYLDIIMFYISKGITVIRLDAIAYLWKRVGTNCIHLPETHEVVKLIRDIFDVVAPHVTIITETNVPHDENVSYFGMGDEAHMIYQFSLPPLLLYTLLFQNATYLTRWAKNLESPPANCYYFNFLASHDGVGVRPLEGLVPDEDFKALVDSIPEQGGLVSKKANADGSESPYELNITYFSALADSELVKEKYQIQRFLCAHTIMLTLQGVPGIYIHSMLATSNDHEGVKTKKYNRAINRRQWEYDELNSLLDDENTEHAQVFEALKERLKIRSQQPAFHPEAPQKIYSVDPAFFTVIRRSHDNTQTILSVSNVTNEPQTLEKEKYALPLNRYDSYENLLGEDITASKEPIILQPFESIWLVIK
ncbi:MAG TPA: alpha-amylase [Balneolaceae bacterium]|nr:alpha-amylase [Balneolaceae bacterium]|tara:strand:+ start:20665 stop:22401 length:1737 start_codon:yes stop_codon:yes gene_type:complete